MEHWSKLEEFPLYEVSDHGQVRNSNTRRILKLLNNGTGSVMVTLRRDGSTHSRSVRRLVAETFLGNPEESDPYQNYSVILLDGDPHNNHIDNLDWRPRWYAAKWGQQQKATVPRVNRPIQDIESGKIWMDSLACALDIGVLEDHVIRAAGQFSRTKGHELRYIT